MGNNISMESNGVTNKLQIVNTTTQNELILGMQHAVLYNNYRYLCFLMSVCVDNIICYILVMYHICYPFDSTPNKWLTIPVDTEDRIYGDDTDDTPDDEWPLKYFNVQSFDRKVLYADGCVFPRTEKNYTLYFHASDRRNVENIIRNGICLNKGKPQQEFSDGWGFYLSMDYHVALRRAKMIRGKPSGYNQRQQNSSAIIVFKVKNDVLSTSNRKVLQAQGDDWSEVITFNRTGRDREKFGKWRQWKTMYDSKTFDYIEGPICSNGGKVGSGELPADYGLKTQQYTQLCILSENMAKCIGDIRNMEVIFHM